ncbi:MAG: hypothetical protein IT539_11170 [Bradyrhizobiaceae bacterium]|nr:hypothetical protein [Bradyrhizobiaceae bacterium]
MTRLAIAAGAVALMATPVMAQYVVAPGYGPGPYAYAPGPYGYEAPLGYAAPAYPYGHSRKTVDILTEPDPNIRHTLQQDRTIPNSPEPDF